jgi:signal transduction histidine kinase/ActR/RegA family two-component response regulator
MASQAPTLESPDIVRAASGAMPMALVDAQGLILDANAGFRRLCRADLPAVRGRTVRDALGCAANEGAANDDALMLPGDPPVWVRPVTTPAGGHALVVLLDISPERGAWTRASSAMRERAQLMAEAEVGTWRYNPDLQTYSFSEELALGWGSIGAPVPLDVLQRIQHPEDRAKDAAIRERLVGEGGSAEGEMRYRDAAGGWRTLRVHYRTGQRLPSGLFEMFGISQNVSELACARDLATAATAAKSNFLASMSHEIRTPLNGVLGMAQVLQADDLTESQREKVALIHESGQTLMALLNDVLDISKIEAGKLEIAPVDGELALTIERLRQLFEPRAAEKGLAVTLSVSADLPKVLKYDPVRVRQCVSNFLSNAIKFTEAGKVEIRITSRPAAEGRTLVRIRVIDTGMGMNADTLSRLFSPFTQADSSIARKFGGTGLGLAIARQLARLMGGEVSAESVEGEGSTFELTFLADPGSAVAPGADAANGTASDAPATRTIEGARVLLVDDNPLNRKVATLFLKAIDPKITEAVNGLDALEKLAAGTFDIVLLDVHMPVLDGQGAIARIRSSHEPWRTIPVIALTADAMSGDRERYIAMGMDDYISKPIDQRELITKIVTLLRKAAPARGADAA